jgi:hypothetical protein
MGRSKWPPRQHATERKLEVEPTVFGHARSKKSQEAEGRASGRREGDIWRSSAWQPYPSPLPAARAL